MTSRSDETSTDSTVDGGLLADISSYYTAKLQAHGPSPRGVDWNGPESQQIRFRQLSRIVAGDRAFSINDLGCGYGAYFEFLKENYSQFAYVGYDVSPAMISAARERSGSGSGARYHVGAVPTEFADYGVASGIFNVRLTHGVARWRDYVNATLDQLNRTSRLAFAFNCLTTYSEPDKIRTDLFYADPCEIFDHCKRAFSRHVALLHDYGLYEFTILVRKAL